MLVPEDPAKRPALWAAVASQLTQAPICFSIKDGIADPLAEAMVQGRNEAELVLARLRRAQISRISANRGVAISPHFAGKREGDTVFITEFLTSPSDGALTVSNKKLERDLETAVINLLFTEEGVGTVFMPLSITPWVMQDAKVCATKEGLLFSKQN